MRRSPGALLPLEADILTAAVASRRSGEATFHGYRLAKRLSDDDGRRLIGHGTLYKALGRLTDAGLVTSVWEDPDVAVAQGRPRRRLYEITGAGEQALVVWQTAHRRSAGRARPGWEPT
jgi:PadR family transcriptional regulator PadR